MNISPVDNKQQCKNGNSTITVIFICFLFFMIELLVLAIELSLQFGINLVALYHHEKREEKGVVP